MLNEILQSIAAAIFVILAIVWIVRRIRRKGSGSCNCGCDECPLSKNCNKK